MTDKTPEICWNSCASCKRNTHHTVVHELVDGPDDPDDYPLFRYYQIVQCNGCDRVSFRKQTLDHAELVEDEHGQYGPSETIEVYPRFLGDHRGLNRLHVVPQVVRDIYQETINAAKEGALTLAGIGFRAVIEAICNDRAIKGKDLQKRIAGLVKEGWITAMEADRLHAIRFLGNDAAHDIKSPPLASLHVVLRIVEHLIENIYILDSEAQGKLETVINAYDDFKKVLTVKLHDFPAGTEQPLSNFLGKTIRRLVDTFPVMEKQLVAEIQSGGFAGLQLGKTTPVGMGPTASHVQHFVKV
jgi:hypothetical protein